MTPPSWHAFEISEIDRKLKTSPDGLSDSDAANRLTHRRNEITHHKVISPWCLLFKQLVNYFVLVLIFAAILAFGVSFLPGESGRRFTAYFILGIIVFSVVLSFFEEYRSPKELEALDKLLVF
jgi:Ca2+-transporting ATPase